MTLPGNVVSKEQGPDGQIRDASAQVYEACKDIVECNAIISKRANQVWHKIIVELRLEEQIRSGTENIIGLR